MNTQIRQKAGQAKATFLARFPVLQEPRGPMLRAFITLLAVACFSALFYHFLGRINPRFYFTLDDGVITLSHARNLVDFGFIGVNPSGDRVEGFSAPTQFWLYALVYAVTKANPVGYTIAQTLVSTLLLGWMMYLLIRRRPGDIPAALFTVFAAIPLSFSAPFIEWQASGMENAVTHALLLGLMLLGIISYQQRRFYAAFVAVAILASLSRLEAVYHVLPMVLIWAAFMSTRDKPVKIMATVFTFIAAWASYHLFRYLYFGDLVPNTAFVQNIHILENLKRISVRPDWEYIHERITVIKEIFQWLGGGYFVAGLVLFPLAKKEGHSKLFLCFIISIFVTTMTGPFIFGFVRLDQLRPFSYLPVFTVLFFLYALLRLDISRRNLIIALLTSVALAGFLTYTKKLPYPICCYIDDFDQTAHEWMALGEKEEMVMPTAANIDLGIISWHKKYNIIDLGRLGNPTMARLYDDKRIAEYFFEIAKPDLLELHGGWACAFNPSILLDPRFAQEYEGVHTSPPKTPCMSGVWIRKDIKKDSASQERIFLDALRRVPIAEYPSLVGDEIEHCRKGKTISACDYISRTLYRFMPELRRNPKVLARLKEMLFALDHPELHIFYLTSYGDSQAYKQLLRRVEELMAAKAAAVKAAADKAPAVKPRKKH